jgi:hypothetical protein
MTKSWWGGSDHVLGASVVRIGVVVKITAYGFPARNPKKEQITMSTTKKLAVVPKSSATSPTIKPMTGRGIAANITLSGKLTKKAAAHDNVSTGGNR